MNVERRYSNRRPVDFSVSVKYRGRRFPLARATDLSTDGMSIRLPGVTLPAGTLVELEFSRWNRDWLIPAVVTHGDMESFGVIFRDSQPKLFAAEINTPNPTVKPPLSLASNSAQAM